MKLQVILAVVSLCSTISVFGEDKLKVGLFYESYCPDCIQVVGEQLLNVYKRFVDNMQLRLVPYGNAQQWFVDDHWEFECQHGPRECLGNKLHACAIFQECGDSGTVSCKGDKISQVLKYISCVMKHDDQLQATSKCAKSSKLDANNIISCAKGAKGDDLLNFYGNQTREFAPWKKYVAAVSINGEHDKAAEDNLMDRLCQLKPSVCAETRDEQEVLSV